MLYVADIGNHRIRRIDLADGTIRTIAGNGQAELPRDGSQPPRAADSRAAALAITGRTLWIALREGQQRLADRPRLAGASRHVAGTGSKGYSGDGGPRAAATFNGPKGIAATPDGLVYVVDTENQVDPPDRHGGRPHLNRGRRRPAGTRLRGREEPAWKPNSTARTASASRPTASLYIGDTNNHRVAVAARQAIDW